MNGSTPAHIAHPTDAERKAAADRALRADFHHVRLRWCWLFFYGLLLAIAGTMAIIVPAITETMSVVAMIVLGTILMVTGFATIIAAFWVGNWSGTVLQVICGVLYVVSGFIISDKPLASAAMMTVFIAAFFIMLGLSRMIVAILLRFPHRGWTILNGLVTFFCGVVIFRHVHENALWVVGLLVGLEMLFHGLNWIMLSLAIRKIQDEAPGASSAAPVGHA